MAFSITDIQSRLVGGGMRPGFFNVQVTNPVNNIADLDLPFLASGSSIPSFTIEPVPVAYFGRAAAIKVGGERVFDNWSITVYNDENSKIRNAMEQWNNAINSLEGNILNFSTSAPSNYKSQATVTQYAKTGQTILRQYTLKGLFPLSISAMELSWADGNSVQTFNVTFSIDDFAVSGGTTGNAGGI